MASNTRTICQACGFLIDHRSPMVKREGQVSLRSCINCGHVQRCEENIISKQNMQYIEFLDKLMASPKVEVSDGMRAKWLRDELTKRGYVPESQLSEFRRLKHRYDTEI